MAERLKDRFFQPAFLDRLAARIADEYPAFDRRRFLGLVLDDTWDRLELKGRMRHVTEALVRTLPQDYRAALAVVMAVERDFDGFDHLLFSDYV